METRVRSLPSDQQNKLREAYEAVLPEAQKLKKEELIHINIDVNSAAGTVQAAARVIAGYGDQIKTLESIMGVVPVDRIEQQADALMWAQGKYDFAITPPDGVTEIYQEGLKTRDVFVAAFVLLGKCGLIPEVQVKRLEDMRGTVGFRAVAESLAGATQTLEANWESIKDKVPLTREDLNRAANIAAELSRAAAERERQSENINAATLIRSQMFTLLMKSYDKVQRALTFLRWEEEDADKIAPSPYIAGRGNGKKKPEEGDVPANGDGSGTTTPPATGVATPPAPPVVPPVAVPTGHMGGSPYGNGQ